ncbi:amidohydrolase family protein [Mycoplasmopsis pulmonis]|nr:N-acetylglucosamine-6-phosphate deacetylase [Mycoplasmopsis pulmonis]VEU68131.1 N-acetylglucosamine-6-phosphate deacetylase [Mycoplasmopsis pulmonis]
MEGPFISKEKKGAHDENIIIPLNEKYLEFFKKQKNLKTTIVVAPEENDYKLIKKYSSDFHFSIGHSNCFDFSKKFNLKYFKSFTHFFNGSSGFDHKKEGLINTIFSQKLPSDFLVEIISDGIHVSSQVLKLTYQILNIKNLIVVSDSLSPKGLKDGVYFLGNLEIKKENKTFYLNKQNTIAGSALEYNKNLKFFKESTNASWTDIVYVSSYNLAKNLKLQNKYGTIKVGQKANLVLIDKDFNILFTYVNGKKY